MKNIFFAFFLILQICNFCQAQELPTVNKIAPIKMMVVHRGLGAAKVVFTSEKTFDLITSEKTKFYQGYVTIRNKTLPAAGTLHNNKLTVTFPGRVHGSRQSRQRLYTIKKTETSIKVSGVSLSTFSEKSCASEHEIGSDKKEHVVSAQAIPTVRVMTISTFADAEWYQKYGNNSNVQIATIINTAEAIYHAQLGLRFRIVSQAIDTNSTPEIDPGQVLSAFQKQTNTKTGATLKHLFTGKDMTGATVGIAYVGAVCYAPDWSYGVTQHYGSLTANIFAHEIGHNLGAQHDAINYGTVMYPSISYGDVLFSAYSVNQINTHLSYFGSCLEYQEETPTLTITKNKTRIIITLTVNKQAINNEQIVYKISGIKAKTAVTSTAGVIKILIKKRGKYAVRAYMKSNPSITARATLKF